VGVLQIKLFPVLIFHGFKKNSVITDTCQSQTDNQREVDEHYFR